MMSPELRVLCVLGIQVRCNCTSALFRLYLIYANVSCNSTIFECDSPLLHRLSAAPTCVSRTKAYAPHMIAAEKDGHQDGQHQTECRPMTVRHMTARKVCNRRNAVQNAAAIRFNACVQHVFPVVPSDGRRYHRHETAHQHQRIADGEHFLLIVGTLFGHGCTLYRLVFGFHWRMICG